MKGGWIMLRLGLCSLVSLTIIIDRYFFFRRRRAASRVEEVIALTRKGRIKEALRIADVTEGAKVIALPVMKVLATGITHPLEPGDAMQAAALAKVSIIKRGLVALDTIITLVRPLGLLGTIIGMINAFNVMAAARLG